MKTLLGLLAFVGLTPILVTACQWGCSEVGCEDGVRVSVSGLRAKHADSLPLTIHACGGATCVDAKVSVDASGALACNMIGGFCDLVEPTGYGPDFVVVHVPARLEPGPVIATISVVEDRGGEQLFQGATTVDATEGYPNGERCGAACVGAQASFAVD